jgi:hypothetical protein
MKPANEPIERNPPIRSSQHDEGSPEPLSNHAKNLSDGHERRTLGANMPQTPQNHEHQTPEQQPEQPTKQPYITPILETHGEWTINNVIGESLGLGPR